MKPKKSKVNKLKKDVLDSAAKVVTKNNKPSLTKKKVIQKLVHVEDPKVPTIPTKKPNYSVHYLGAAGLYKDKLEKHVNDMIDDDTSYSPHQFAKELANRSGVEGLVLDFERHSENDIYSYRISISIRFKVTSVTLTNIDVFDETNAFRKVETFDIFSEEDLANRPDKSDHVIETALKEYAKKGWFLYDDDAIEFAMKKISSMVDALRHRIEFANVPVDSSYVASRLSKIFEVQKRLTSFVHLRNDIVTTCRENACEIVPNILPEESDIHNWTVVDGTFTKVAKCDVMSCRTFA